MYTFFHSCLLLDKKKRKSEIGIGIGRFTCKKSVSESAMKNHDRASLVVFTIYTFMYDYRKYNVNSFIGHSVVLQYVTVHRVEQI